MRLPIKLKSPLGAADICLRSSIVNAIQIALAAFVSIVGYGLFVIAVYELFAISTLLTEIRDQLKGRALTPLPANLYLAHSAPPVKKSPKLTVLNLKTE
jgi:hypothetical protein